MSDALNALIYGLRDVLAGAGATLLNRRSKIWFRTGFVTTDDPDNARIIADVNGVELPEGAAAGDLFYLDGAGEFVRVPIGAEGQVLAVVGGVPAWADGGGVGGGGLDPATEPLTIYLENFTGSPWNGIPSAGNSGSHNFSEATNPPTATGGAAVFDGVNDKIGGAGGNVGSDYFGVGTADTWALDIVYEITNSDLTAPYGPNPVDALNEPSLIADTGAYLAISISTSGVKVTVNDGTYKGVLVAGTSTATGKHNLQVRSDGTNIYAREGNGAWSSFACAGIQVPTTQCRLGVNNAGTVFFKGKLWSVKSWDTLPTTTTMDDMYTRNAAEFGF